MTNSIESKSIDPAPDVDLDKLASTLEAPQDIVSVNAKKSGSGGNPAAKGIFLLTIAAVVLGGATWYGQHWLSAKKDAVKPGGMSGSAAEAPNLLNPEKTGTAAPAPKLGSASGSPPPEPKVERPGPKETADGVRPMRGPDGKVVVDAQGRAMGVDPNGNVVSVPAIDVVGGTVDTKKPLPGQTAAPAYSSQQAGNGQPTSKPPSRYAGALFVDGESGSFKPTSSTDAGNGSTPPPPTSISSYAEILRAVNAAQGGGSGAAAPTPAPVATPYIGQPIDAIAPAGGSSSRSDRAGTVGESLHSTATPVARAKRFQDQNLVLPKGRQADCVLTGRISDEVPGFTSCVLSQNLYSDNGRVLLLERGSELSGEYGVINQPGMRRLFVTWNRVKTPNGIEVNLSSPGADALGTSGLPGHLDNRWGERIGAALILSFLKDVSVAVINNMSDKNNSGSTTVTVQPPGQNTVNAGFSIADEVVRQTLKVRPTLTINEGDKIAIYVARDLDFSPVYALKSVGATGTASVR